MIGLTTYDINGGIIVVYNKLYYSNALNWTFDIDPHMNIPIVLLEEP